MSNSYLTAVDHKCGCTRRHAIKVFAACAGGVILGGRLSRALADLPWGETPPAEMLQPGRLPLSPGREEVYGKAERQAHPALALEPGGKRLWTSWTQLHRGHESILVRAFSLADKRWETPLEMTLPDQDRGPAHESEIAFADGRLVVVWTELTGTAWVLLARTLDPASGQAAPIVQVSTPRLGGTLPGHPALAANGQSVLAVWHARPAGRENYAILARVLTPDGGPVGEELEVAVDPERDCRRPAVAASPDGKRFAVTFQRHDRPGTQNIYLVTIDAETREVSEPQPVTTHPASDLSPALAYSPDGELLWVAWHSNRRGEDGWDVTPWYRIATLRTCDGTWHVPVGADEPPPSNERGTVQGFELVRLAVSNSGVICVLGRASHNFYVQYYSSEGKSPLFRLPEDGWGGRGRLVRGVFDSNASLWVARRDLGANILTRIDGFADLSGPPALIPTTNHSVVPTTDHAVVLTTDHAVIPTTEGRRDLAAAPDASRTRGRIPRRSAPRNDSAGAAGGLELRRACALSGITPRYEWPEPGEAARGLRVYFGDIHGHSWQSDGMGDPEASYLRARDLYHDDFHVLTDHDHFVGKRLNDAQWQEQKDLVEHHHAPGSFVTLFGQEWTTPRVGRPHGWGHFNVYSADPTIPLFDHTDPRWRDLQDLYAAIRRHNAIAIPHHIGWTGVPWDAIDAELTPVVEICSVHGAFEYEGNEPIRHRGGMKGCFYRDGLKAALRVGVVGGSDQHGLTWHHGVCWKRNPFRAGLTGVWAPQLTRDAILAAFRSRRTFATTGVKLQLYFAVNDGLMGGVIEANGPPTIHVDVAVPPQEGRLAWLEIVRDGMVAHRYGGEGQRSRYTFVDKQCPLFAPPNTKTGTGNFPRSEPVPILNGNATCSYYLRVTLADNNMAWSSPVWVTRI
jgi:hypothetical protein